MREIILASTNQAKLRELSALLAICEMVVKSAAEFPAWQPVDEIGATFAANAILKAENGCAQTGLPTLADDSGLLVDYLNGAPGIHSARFAALDGAEGAATMAQTDDAANNRLLLEKLRGVPTTARRAKYACVIAYSAPGKMPRCFYGETHGYILETPRGDGGFGYDPLFFSLDLECSFGEAAPERKNTVSHRGRALRQLQDFFHG